MSLFAMRFYTNEKKGLVSLQRRRLSRIFVGLCRTVEFVKKKHKQMTLVQNVIDVT